MWASSWLQRHSQQARPQAPTFHLGGDNYEVVENFVNLGLLVNSHNHVQEDEKRRRIESGNRCLNSLRLLFRDPRR